MPTTCSGGTPYTLLGVRAHEVLTASGDDIGLVAVRAQVLQNLQHRLIDQFRVRAIPARMLCRGHPPLRLGREFVHAHAAECRGEDLFQVRHREFGDCCMVTGQNRFEGFDVLQFRLLRDHRWNAVEAVGHLRVDRMLDPQRAVLIEGRDTSLRRDEVRTRLVGRRAHEVHDALLCRAVVPRRQRICLRMGIDGGEEQRQKSDR